MPITNVIELSNVSYAYNGEDILDKVSLAVKSRDFLGIIGPNGGGKSTLLRLMLGLLRPRQGSLRVLGEDPARARQRVGYVAQDTNRQRHFPITVFETVLLGRLSRSHLVRRYTAEDRRQSQEMIEHYGLEKLSRDPIASLSGGQRQKVMIARALVSNPEIVILDEPTANLDSQASTEIYEHLHHLNERAAVILVSHDLAAISSHITSLACVNRRLVYHPEGRMTPEMLEATYGCPFDLFAHGVPHRVLEEHGDNW